MVTLKAVGTCQIPLRELIQRAFQTSRKQRVGPIMAPTVCVFFGCLVLSLVRRVMVDHLVTPSLEPNLRPSWLETRLGLRMLARLQRSGPKTCHSDTIQRVLKCGLDNVGNPKQ
jgi:hypothetical protein